MTSNQSIKPEDCLLVKRRSDGELFRHHTLTAGAFPIEKYWMITGVYDNDGFLKSRWWQVPLTEETKATEEARRQVISESGRGEGVA